MIREAPAMTVRQNLGELLNEVQYRHDSILITKSGKPIAAMVDIDLFERMRSLEDEFNRLALELAGVYKDSNEQVARDEIAQAIKASRHK